MNPLFQVGFIIVIGLGLYLHTLHAPFLLDDRYCITENPAIRSFDYLLDFDKIRDLAIWDDIKNNMMLRPVAYWTFALNYQVGGYSEIGYHLVNIVIHLLNAVFVYLLARGILGRIRITWSSPDLARLVPLLTALLFVAHPLQTQAVTYINQRFTSLTVLLYLGALLLYIAARTSEKPVLRWVYYSLALLTTIFAMKTKAIAFTLPFTMFLYDSCFLDATWRQRLTWAAPFALTLLIIPGTLYWLVATDGIDDPRGRLEQSINLANLTGTSQWDYLRTQFKVLVTYLRMFLLPVGQNIIPYFRTAPELFAPGGGIPSLMFLLLLFGSAAHTALRAIRSGQRTFKLAIAFGILWFFVTISMSSSIIPLDAMMLEYRCYLPSVGIFLAAALTLAMAADRYKLPFRTFVGGAVVVIALFGATTYARNSLYNDSIRLLQDILEKNPEAWPARVSLAGTFLSQERYAEAVPELERILQYSPYDVNMIVNLGYALNAMGRKDEALTHFRRALGIDPGNAFVRGNLGLFYLDRGLLQQGETELLTALAIDPHFGAARQSLAGLYENLGRIPEAREQYFLLLKSYPDNKDVEAKLRTLGGR